MPQKDVAILFGMLALGACTSSGSKAPDSAAGTPPARPERAVAANIEPELLYEKVAPSILRVETFRSNAETGDIEPVAAGSAIAVGPSAYLTSCHVLEGGQHIAIVQDDRPIMADLETSHHRADVCLIRTSKPVGAPVTGFREFADLRIGERVYTVGNPQGFDLTLADGIVSSKRRREDDTRWVQTTAPISPGSSGGGLFDAQGNLIGITNFYWEDGQQLNFASAIEPAYLPRTGQLAAVVNNPAATPMDLGVAEQGERKIESAIAALLATAAANRDGDTGDGGRSYRDRRAGRTGDAAGEQDDAGSNTDGPPGSGDGSQGDGGASGGDSGGSGSDGGSSGDDDSPGSDDSGSDNGGSNDDSGSDDGGSDDGGSDDGGSDDSGSDDGSSDSGDSSSDNGSGSDDSGSSDDGGSGDGSSGSDDSGSGSDDSGSGSDDSGSGSDDSGSGSDDSGSSDSDSGSGDSGSGDSGGDDSDSGSGGDDSDNGNSGRGSRGRGSEGRGSDRGGSDDGGDSDD